MYKGDSVYKVILNYNFDLFRGELEVSEYLEKHFNQYVSDIQVAINKDNHFIEAKFISMLEEKIPLIKEICSQIIDVSKKYSQGLIKEAYIKAYDLFDDKNSYFMVSSSRNERNRFFYRLRPGDFRITDANESKEKKSELFHIKRNKKHLISAYRYSVSGFPCLYLASRKELAWFECGMPKQFSYCEMIIDEEGDNALRLVDFSNRPMDFLSNIHNNLLNAKNDENRKEIIYEYLLQYIITYPLVAACSIKVKNRNNNFVEEYVIPQIFMQWIRESNYFAGVIYKSSLDSNLVQGMGAINIALPVKEFRSDGLGENLTSKISVSNIGYLDVNEYFLKYKTYLDDIETYKNDIWADLINSKYQCSYAWELIELCETVINTYDALMNGNYKNSELIFSHIDCLANHISIIYRNKKSIVDECVNEAFKHMKMKVDKDKIIKQIDDFYKLMSKVVHKHMVFHFNFENLGNYEKI